MRGVQLAVIDLGSNSFRLVVFSAAGERWKRTDEIYEPVRIGEGLAATGALGAAPMERALSTLEVFAHFCKAAGLGPDAIDAVATSAIRDASNSAAFLARARKRTRLPIRVLSREQEAQYGYLAAVNSTTLRTAASSTSAAARCSSSRSPTGARSPRAPGGWARCG
jgi:exopolyphosphatase/guanosine-5'-triphosphate,3'-diphosphate pyrophosphatase